MCAPHPINPLGSGDYAPPNIRNAKRDLRKARARKNFVACRIADAALARKAVTDEMLDEYVRAKHAARRAELRVDAIGKADRKEAV